MPMQAAERAADAFFQDAGDGVQRHAQQHAGDRGSEQEREEWLQASPGDAIGLRWGTVLTNGRLVHEGGGGGGGADRRGRGQPADHLLSQHALNRIQKVTQALCAPVHRVDRCQQIALYSLPWCDERGLACKVWIESPASSWRAADPGRHRHRVRPPRRPGGRHPSQRHRCWPAPRSGGAAGDRSLALRATAHEARAHAAQGVEPAHRDRRPADRGWAEKCGCGRGRRCGWRRS